MDWLRGNRRRNVLGAGYVPTPRSRYGSRLSYPTSRSTRLLCLVREDPSGLPGGLAYIPFNPLVCFNLFPSHLVSNKSFKIPMYSIFTFRCRTPAQPRLRRAHLHIVSAITPSIFFII